MDHDPLTAKYVGPIGPLVLSGEIIPGDYVRLLARITDDEDRYMLQNKITLASNGGDVSEAIKIAGLLQSLFSTVTVGPQTGPCVAACFLIYAAAEQRSTDGEHLIGLHRPTLAAALSSSLQLEQATALEDKALAQVRGFLAANDVPNYLLDEMFHRSADEVYWLSEHDEATLGHKSLAYRRYLTTNCAWDESLEKEALSGSRPFKEFTDMQACRDRLTQAAARKALAQANAAEKGVSTSAIARKPGERVEGKKQKLH